MTDEPGWIFYFRDGDGYRNFTVGVENEDAAKLAIQTEFPHVKFLNFVTKQRAPADLIEILKLSGGKIMEWVSADPKQPLQPQGVDIDSDYDPLRKTK
jgi:hypothetical protein